MPLVYVSAGAGVDTGPRFFTMREDNRTEFAEFAVLLVLVAVWLVVVVFPAITPR